MLKRVLLVGVGVGGALVVATSMASTSDSRGPRASTVSRVIATLTTSDFRAILTARQTGAGGAAGVLMLARIQRTSGHQGIHTLTHT
jgi:hypothetical protein